MPFLLAEILNFQGSTHRIGVGSFSKVNNQVSFHTSLALEHLTFESRKEV